MCGFTQFECQPHVERLTHFRALVIVGSMGSFEPMDFWKFLNLTYLISFTEDRVHGSET